LVDAGVYTYSAAHQFRSSLTGVAGGAHPGLTSKTIVSGVFDAADVTLLAVAGGPTVDAAVVYQDTGNPATDRLISYNEIASVTPDGSDITVTWSGNGVFRLLPPGTNASASVPTFITTRSIPTPVLSAIPVASGLSVVITRDSDGATATYSDTVAVDLGNYGDPLGQFTQRCLRAGPNATFQNFYVHFRPDVGTTRKEIVFEYGACFNGSRTYMTSYHASIRVDGVEVANIAVPYHFHFSRWRWNPTPRTMRTPAAAMIAAKLAPPLVASQTKGSTPAPPTVAYTPMGLAGLYGDMTTTGDHYEIGMVTEHQSYWLCTGNGASTMLAQAEASGTYPWHYRDENTGAPLNKTTYNQASEANSNSPNPYLARDGSLNGTGGIPFISTDLAHHPSLCAVPFMATGDPYYLEELQFCANWTALTQNWTYRAINTTSHILETGGEFLAIRASGWMSRTVAQAAKLTPASVPSWLLPQSYFQAYNDQLVAYFTSRCITTPSAPYTLFRTIERVFGDNSDTGFTAGTYGQPYMEDYVGCAWNYAAWMHPATGWVALAEWKRGNAVARSNGTSGWEKAETSPYRYQMRATPSSTFYTTWGQAWSGTQAILNMTYTPGVLDVSNQIVVDYGCYIRALATWGKIFSDATCDGPFTYLDTSLMAVFGTGGKFCSYKWAVDPTAVP